MRVSETTPMVLAEGHNTRWPWTSLPCSRCSRHCKAADVDDRIRPAAETIYQALIEAELTAVIGAGPHERTDAADRAAQRSPAADADDDGRGSGAADPEAADRVVLPVAAGAPAAGRPGAVRGGDGGLPARRLDPQGRRPGQGAGRRHRDLQVRGVADLRRPRRRGRRVPRPRRWPSSAFPYVFLDATYCKARVNRRVVSQAVVIATGVAADGRREVLGFDVGDSEDGAFWTAFLRSLKARGLAGVQLVISDAHTGLKAAIGAVLLGAAWQRCRVHFLRNVLAAGPQGQRRDGRRRDPHHLRPARRRARPRAARRHRRHARPAVPQGRGDAARRRATTCSPSPASRSRTGRRSGRPTRSSGSTRRSNAAPTSSASSPTPPPCSAWPAPSWSRPTTNGRSADRRYLSEGSMALLNRTDDHDQEVAHTGTDRGIVTTPLTQHGEDYPPLGGTSPIALVSRPREAEPRWVMCQVAPRTLLRRRGTPFTGVPRHRSRWGPAVGSPGSGRGSGLEVVVC